MATSAPGFNGLSADIAIFANGVTNPINMAGYAIAGIIVPQGLVGTALTIQVSTDGVTYYPLRDSTGAVLGVSALNASPAAYCFPILYNGFPFVQVASNAAANADDGKQISILGQQWIK